MYLAWTYDPDLEFQQCSDGGVEPDPDRSEEMIASLLSFSEEDN